MVAAELLDRRAALVQDTELFAAAKCHVLTFVAAERALDLTVVVVFDRAGPSIVDDDVIRP